jgi:CheY-like chemotaxis protein
MRVLLVEDNPVTVDALSELMKLRGHEVSWAGNGHGALTRLGVERPDVLVVDLLMPGLDGVGLVEQLRKRPLCVCLPVVCVTAAAESDLSELQARLEQAARPCPGSNHECPVRRIRLLRKPFEYEELEKLLLEVTTP